MTRQGQARPDEARWGKTRRRPNKKVSHGFEKYCIWSPCAANHLLVNMNAFARGVKISIGTHTRSGSTMINTTWHAKIDAQELFYFMIFPVGGKLIDLAGAMKARLELYTDAHGALIFDNYDKCSPKNHERTHRVEVGYHWLQHKTTYVTASPRSDYENKTKWELSALVSSRSLDERTAVESQTSGLYLTSWCRHHNTVFWF